MSGSSRSLWPREHGAYAQLAAPLATALAIATPSVGGVLLASAACCAFLTNEPLLVLRGHRGRRMRDEHGSRAARRLAITASAAAAGGGLGLAFAPAAAAISLVVAAPAAFMFLLAWLRAERSWWGELVAAIALPAAGAPVMVASGITRQTAIMIWLAWSLGFACSVVAVHRVLARHRKPSTWRDPVIVVALGAVASSTLAAALVQPLFLASTLLAVTAAALAASPPSARHLRLIGVVLTAASVVAGSVIVAFA